MGRIVNAGKQHILDKVYNQYPWNTSNILYIGVGQSSNTNAGVKGPSGTDYTSISGVWRGVSDSDWKLTDEVTGSQRAVAQCVRAGNSAYLVATIDDNNIDWVASEYGGISTLTFREVGLFITGTYGPDNDPTDRNASATDKGKAMIARAVKVRIDGVEYKEDNFYQMSDGESIEIKIEIKDFE